MNFKRNSFIAATILSGLIATPSAMALNIVLTNDDSWNTININTLKAELIKAGHSVVMSAPCGPQSGKGGSMIFMKATPVDERVGADGSIEYCVGETDGGLAFDDYVEGTPVMAALYGIDVAAQKVWGQAPDLVISGPNEGNNLGFMNNNSGTLGATMASLSRGIPAIAVSDGKHASEEGQAKLVAAAIVDLVKSLEENRPAGQPLLPAYTGLNVNTPADMSAHLGYKFTDVGWNGGGTELKFTNDLGSDPVVSSYVTGAMLAQGMSQDEAEAAFHSMYDGQIGLSFAMGPAGDENPNSEGVAVQEGYITISTIDGNVQASRAKVELTQQRLSGLK
ncbi:5'/3'-nucleotidase SurE [Vibrio algivorus]|uniref:5'-nucleotidase n=1 Tax=Vibrio algivorus TaxID=1667024 RepID=A0A557NYE1_9VIBR|nr:5'/3'-nucleotidase SurE [Vibrio algivorus]TVO33408.1 acid phosphatase [Vibrio algivorus]